MGLTYTYDTRQITRDFHLKKVDAFCHRDPDKSVLIGVMCRTCPFYGGSYTHWSRELDRTDLVKCKFHKEDDPGLSEIIYEMYRKFEEEAITHFYD